ncbi:MAG: hypothetical protein HUU06_02270 [Planctomycetaceae bacterium]|nr:hypothetical protein [Planctomycetaceae bacterium]
MAPLFPQVAASATAFGALWIAGAGTWGPSLVNVTGVASTYGRPVEASHLRRSTIASDFMALVAHLGDILALEANWDSYASPRIDRGATSAALVALLSLASISPEAPAPFVVPTSRGGVQLEWHEQGVDLEIEIRPDGKVLAFYSCGDASHELSGNLVEIVSSHEVREAILALQG